MFQVDLVERKKKGSFIQVGSADILTTALGKPEHSGRVRGVGAYVGHKLWFQTLEGISKVEYDLHVQSQ